MKLQGRGANYPVSPGENIVTRPAVSSFPLSVEFAVKTRKLKTVILRDGDIVLLEA